jgi:hypothetical protein
VILARNDPAGAATLRSIAEEVRAFGLAFIVAVRQVRGGLSSEQMARAGGVADVIALGEERGLMAGLAHGVLPGERITGPLAAAADALLKVLAAPKQPAPNSDRNPYPAVQTKPSRLPDQAASDLMEPSSLPPEDAATWRPGTLAACDTGQTKRTSRPRHRRTKTLPAFNPAAFAEEW